MKNLELASPSEMSAIVRTAVAEAPIQREVGLGLLLPDLARRVAGRLKRPGWSVFVLGRFR